MALGGFFGGWRSGTRPGIILNEIGSLAMKQMKEGQKVKQLQVAFLTLMELAFMSVESDVKGVVESDKLQYY